jgi:hypothetical protein
MVPIGVTIQEQGLGNHAASELSLVAIVKIDNVRLCVKDWVVIGKSNWIAVPVSLLHGHVALSHHTSRQVVVPHYRHYFCITIVRIDDVGVFMVLRVWGQVFSRDVLWHCCRSKLLFDWFIKLVLHLLMNRADELFISEVLQG